MKWEGLYGIIDPAQVWTGSTPEEVTAAVLRGGAEVIQLRDKVSVDRDLLSLARKLKEICGRFGVPLIVNNRVDIALAAGADGVHLGPEDLPVEIARRLAGSDFLIGGSAGSVEVARRLAREGADYLGVGAIFEARPSKADASAPRGTRVLKEIGRAVDLPLFGIGGIDEENAREVIEAGACGIAVIRALNQAENPEEAARRLCCAISSS